MDSSPSKRKRGQSRTASSSTDTPSHSPSRIDTSFSRDEILGPKSIDSPRTAVAYNFQGLELSTPINKLDLILQTNDSPLSPSEEIRKRVKLLETDGIPEKEIPESPQAPGFKINFGPERALDPYIQEIANGITLHNQVDPVITTAQKSLTVDNLKQKNVPTPNTIITHSAIDRLTSDSKSRNKKRAGTPPLKFNFNTTDEEGGTGTTFLATDQAALTWHDDEITGHRAEDPDDDGRGVNGIGFKPTAAQAYQRLERRRQQMADYKTREAKEARAKRGARRRGSVSDNVEAPKEKEKEQVDAARRVRFLDGDAVVVNAIEM